MEEVLGFGGQLHSFESRSSASGPPMATMRVWSRNTGVIDTAAAEAWKKYDIRLVLEARRAELAPKLAASCTASG